MSKYTSEHTLIIYSKHISFFFLFIFVCKTEKFLKDGEVRSVQLVHYHVHDKKTDTSEK